MRNSVHFVRIVFMHELRDFLRDTATLKTMSILLVLLPIVYSYMIGEGQNRIKETLSQDKRLGYIESPEIHEILPWLQQQGIIPIPVKDKEKDTFSRQTLDAILTVQPKDEMDVPDPVHLNFEIWTNGTNQKKLAAAHFIESMIGGYSRIVIKQNLILAGAAPQLLDPISAQVKSIQPEPKAGSITFDLLVALLGMALFFTTLHLAVDTTAGERERMTLESLLYTEAPRTSVVFGKFLLVAVIAFFGMCWSGGIFWTLGELPFFQQMLGRTSSFTLQNLLLAILIMSPLCLFVAGMQLVIGSLTNSVKQAQAYNSISGMMSLPLSFLFFLDQIKPLNYTPIFGQGLALRKILQGEDWDKSALLISESITVLIAVITLAIVIKRFQTEKIVLTKV